MTRLLIVQNASQLNALRKGRPSLLHESTLLTGDLTTAEILEREGIPFLEESSFLTAEDVERHWEDSHVLAETWWPATAPPFEWRGVSLSACARKEFINPFEAALAGHTVYSRVLRETGAREVALAWESPEAIHRNGPPPGVRGTRSAATAVLRWLCDEQGIAFNPLASVPADEPTPVRQSARNATSLAEHGNSTRRTEGRRLLVFDNGQNLSDVAEIGGAAQAEWEVVRVSEFTRGGFPEWFAPVPELEDLLARCWEAYRADRDREPRFLFANRHLDYQFKRIFDEIRLAVSFAEAADSILQLFAPSAVLFGLDTFTIEQLMLRLARARGIATAALVHGGLSIEGAFREVVSDSDLMFVWGPADRHLAQKFGLPPARIAEVGSPRYGRKYTGLADPEHRDTPAELKRAARERLGIDAGARAVALLTASISQGLTNAVADPRGYRRSWRELLAVAGRRPDITFLIKPKPTYDHVEYYRYLMEFAPPNVRYLEGHNLADALSASDAALLLNYCTTAGLEAMLEGVPLGFVQSAMYDCPRVRDRVRTLGAAVPINTESDLESFLEKVFTDRSFVVAQRRSVESLLQSTLGPKNVRPSDRVLEELTRLVDRSGLANDGVGASGGPIWSGLAECAEALRQSDRTTFATRWDQVVRSIEGMGALPAVEMERVVFAAAYMCGRAGLDPTFLSETIRLVTPTLERIAGGGVKRKVATTAYMAAILDAANHGEWHRVRSFVTLALRNDPRRIVLSPPVWRLIAKSLAAESPLALRASNFIEERIGGVRAGSQRIARFASALRERALRPNGDEKMTGGPRASAR